MNYVVRFVVSVYCSGVHCNVVVTDEDATSRSTEHNHEPADEL